VADIIPLDEKIQILKNKKSALVRKRKIQAVQNVFRCVRCAFKCEKCGMSIEFKNRNRSAKSDTFKIPYNFCENCREEYIDYINYLKGNKNPDNYWYNDSWMQLWKGWIDYQSFLDGYLKSKEFKTLLLEMKKNTPDDEEG